MGTTPSAIQFLGDLSDPWVAAIADALPPWLAIERIDCRSDVPERPFNPGRPPALIVVHRQHGTASDARRFLSWRDARPPAVAPSLILCYGPYFRYAELERVAPACEQMLPEATAADVLPGRLTRLLDPRPRRSAASLGHVFRVEIACATQELGGVLFQRISDAGYRAAIVDESRVGAEDRRPIAASSPGTGVLTIWEVPVLEDNWHERLEARARATGPVIAILGFADRALVTLARTSGAFACVDCPFDSDDVLDLIDRFGRSNAASALPSPPRAEPAHALPPRSRQRPGQVPHPSALARARWPDGRPPSTIE